MLKRITISELRLGMYISSLTGSWINHPFWKSKFLLDQADDLEKLCSCGIKEVWIDTEKGLDVATNEYQTLIDTVEPSHTRKNEPIKVIPSKVNDEIERAKALRFRARDAVANLFNDVRMGRSLECEQAQAIVTEISASINRHPHAFISLARLKNSDDYTYLHSVAVCALMTALGRNLGLNDQQVQQAGLAGLFHDLGKVAIPANILNKPGKLTDAEFTVMKSHPAKGAQLLKDSQQVSDVVIDVCLHHHEKMDGSGYPEGLDKDSISLYARMGAVCDVYDAVTSDRPYKKGWQPAEAIRRMSEWCDGHFDEKIFQAFVKTVGIYPTGSLVRLASGRLGVVVEQNPQALLTPSIKIFFSTKSKVAIPQKVIDLSRYDVDDRIVGRENAEDWGFKALDLLWMS